MANLFQSVLNSFSSFFKSSGGSVVGVDIGTSAIKVVQIKKKGGKAILETYGSLSLGPYDGREVGETTNLPPAKIAQALIDVLKEASTTTKQGALSIPASSSLVFLVALPNTISEREFATIVPTEARKYIPVPITEVSLDYFVIPKRGDYAPELAYGDGADKIKADKTEILVVATQNDAISKYRDILKMGGLESDFFEVEIFSASRASLSHELSSVMILDFGASKTKIYIIEYGVVKVFHVVNRGSFDITSAISKSMSTSISKAEEDKIKIGLNGDGAEKVISDVVKISVDYILSEISSIALDYEKKSGRVLDKILLCGGGSKMPGLLNKIKENFNSDVSFSNPFSKVETPEFLGNVLADIGPEFAVSLGLALRKLS